MKCIQDTWWDELAVNAEKPVNNPLATEMMSMTQLRKKKSPGLLFEYHLFITLNQGLESQLGYIKCTNAWEHSS